MSSSSSSSSSPSSSSCRFLWGEDQVRLAFNNKLWPQYIGNKTNVNYKYYPDREEKATLPVLLWKEQESLFEIVSSRKRTREELCSNDESDQNDDVISEQRHNTDISSMDMRTPKEKIFKELYSKGYFVGPGEIYGGDYSIYKDGDPSSAHSVATVRLILPRVPPPVVILTVPPPSSNAPLDINLATGTAQSSNCSVTHQFENTNATSPADMTRIQPPMMSCKEFLALSRVQNHVAKNTVLAFIDPDTQEAKFLVSNFLYVSERPS